MRFDIVCYSYLKILAFFTVNSVTFPKVNLNKATGALIDLMKQLNNLTDGEKNEIEIAKL